MNTPRNPGRPTRDEVVARWLADARPLDEHEIGRIRIVMRGGRTK